MLNTKLTKSILRTTDNYIKSLEKAGILTVWDLLNHFPRDYEDRTQVLSNFSLVNIKEKNTILLKLVSINSQRTANNKLLTKAVLEDEAGFLAEAVWFNRKYLATQLDNYKGKKILITWKCKYAYWKLSFVSPEVETNLEKVWGEIVPIYSELNYIPSKWLKGKIEILKKYIKTSPQPSPQGEGELGFPENLPKKIVKKYGFISRAEAIYKIHFPKNQNDIDLAKARLSYEELYFINYNQLRKKFDNFKESEWNSVKIDLDAELIKKIISKLDFELTDKQKIVLFQILKDMEKTHSMQRLLEWDVWTGKTIVALISAIHVILSVVPHPLPPSPLRGDGEEVDYSVRKNILKSPWYVFELAKKFRKEPTESEEKLWKLLKDSKFENLKFRRQHPIWRYIADFYCEEFKLIIELDWKIHDEKNRQEYDLERENLLKNYWFNIFRLKNEEILENSEKIIYEKIKNFLTNSPLLQRRGVGGEGEEKVRETNQVAFMAPTEILARQHFNSAQNLLLEFWIKSALLVGSTTKKQKEIIKKDLKNWQIDIVFWTHALVQEDVIFEKLAYVIIDEQHRFWVRQREVLEKYYSPPLAPPPLGEGNNTKAPSPEWGGLGRGIFPHVLNMTATPIPRTLALTLYWDQDLSIINEYPKWRKEIFTKVIKNERQREEVEKFIRNELEKGRQVFWISPLVEESEKIDLANAINTYNSLVEIFAPFKVGLLHWKMKAKEKEQIMADFKENKIQILSSTSVVEVWVDVPNATIMCIEWAERFGLSQLHQFRWRVGRWEFQSYCYLFPSSGNYTDRLRAMEKTNNWFELSEIDLELRWPWEVYWVKQSWVPDLKVASLTDLDLISQIREDIEEELKWKEQKK